MITTDNIVRYINPHPDPKFRAHKTKLERLAAKFQNIPYTAISLTNGRIFGNEVLD
ncbi:MAG: hypothetical protein O7D30_08875 [Rickettsia endosymbiont of Ixodes persulcatus]|nr:hypothetical protein [Rickettsia endosymbiont of Ixodes persulcatus]